MKIGLRLSGLSLLVGVTLVVATALAQPGLQEQVTVGRAALGGHGAKPAAQTPPATSIRARLSEAYGKLPIHFEENRGQTDPRVKFLARGGGCTLFLTSNDAVLLLTSPEPEGSDEGPEPKGQDPRQGRRAALRMTVLGANTAPRVTGRQELPGKANYFTGNSPARWRTNVPTYGRVHYDDIYPGIDLVYYGSQRQLEYDFVVGPGADPGRIVLGFQGADKLEVDAAGDLVLHTAAGPIHQRKPVIYQEVGGVPQPIAGGYVLRGSQEVGFQVAAHDPARPLIIDPVLVYSTYLGGSGGDGSQGIAVDGAGSAYVMGVTDSADFPTTPGAFDMTYNGGMTFPSDASVTKLDPTGSSLVYATYLGGSGWDQGEQRSIAVDGTGSAYVTGLTESTDFPTTPGAFDTSFNGLVDVFVTKLDTTGSALVYSTYLGGSIADSGSGIAVDDAGSAYITGRAESANFPTTPGAFDITYNGGNDAFVTKLDPTGSALAYSTYFGGSGVDIGGGIAVDAAGSAYVSGYYGSSDFPTTPGAFDTTFNGGNDSWVAKLDPTGSALVYSTYLGGSGFEGSSAIALDGAGNAYVTGGTDSPDFPTTPGALDTTLTGATDAFVTKLDPTGSALAYSTYLGGSATDWGYGVAVDDAGSAYVAGETGSPDFPTTPGAFDTTFNGGPLDAFVTKLDPTASALIDSTYLGGNGRDNGLGIALDGAGSVYVTGNTVSTDFPTTPGAFDTTFGGGFEDAFVAKFSFMTPLTITADDKAMLVNGPLPTLTATYTGFVDGDTEADLDTPVSLVTTATGASVGSFPITASGAADPNYTITHANGVLTVNYAAAGTCLGAPGHQILQPINVDGTSVFKRGSTVPAKFRICDANGASVGTPGVVVSFNLIQTIAGTTVSSVNEPVASTTPDTAFRWSPSDQLWIFNIATKSLASDRTYAYRITLNDSSAIDFSFGLK